MIVNTEELARLADYDAETRHGYVGDTLIAFAFDACSHKQAEAGQCGECNNIVAEWMANDQPIEWMSAT